MLITGAVRAPEAVPNEAVTRAYNSVYVIDHRGSILSVYDKVHLVLFGEFVPFRYTSFHTVYQWLNRCMPWGALGKEYSLDFGESFRRFQMPARSQILRASDEPSDSAVVQAGERPLAHPGIRAHGSRTDHLALTARTR